MSAANLRDELVRDIGDRVDEYAAARYAQEPDELEGHQRMFSDEERAKAEVKLLREFIADVRLGIRDLDEYEAICGAVW